MKTKLFLANRCGPLVVLLALLAVVFGSCSDFFTHSLGEWAQRDPNSLIPSVTTGNIQNLLDMTANDPDLSLALLKKIADSNDASDPALQTAALQAAANAAGLGAAILQNAGNVKDLDETTARDIVVNVVNGLGNLGEAASLLTGILPDVTAVTFDPATDPAWLAFTAVSSPGDLAMAAAVLIAADAKASGDPAAFFTTAPPADTLAVRLAVEASKNPGGDDSFLEDVLKGLKLI
jgi:hypothetical protein